MPYADNPERWHQLNALYAAKSDEELLELHTAYNDLTDDAQGILRSELSRRKLSTQQQTIEAASAEPTSDCGEEAPQAETYNEYELLQLGGVALVECETAEEAQLIRFVLSENRIASVLRQRQDRFYAGWPQVLIAPDDLEKAKAILSAGIPPKLRAQFESLPEEVDFQNPACPKCRSADAFLESVEPTNNWQCGDCGAKWHDPLPE